MDEVAKVSSRLAEFINLMKSEGYNKMSVEAFEEQKKSFIVGNAFDMFDDRPSITRQTLIDLEEDRRQIVA